MPISLKPSLAWMVVLSLSACTKSEADDPHTRALHRRSVALHRLGELVVVADSIDRELPDADGRTFTATITQALRMFEYAQVARREEPKTAGVVRTEPVTAVFGGTANDVVRFLSRLDALARPWQMTRISRDDRDVVAVDLIGFVFSAGVLQQTSATNAEIEGKIAALRKAGFSAAQIERLERVAIKQGILGDLREKSSQTKLDADLVRSVIGATGIVPRNLTLVFNRGKKQCALQLDTEEERRRFVTEAARRGAVANNKDHELVLATGRICRVTVGK